MSDFFNLLIALFAVFTTDAGLMCAGLLIVCCLCILFFRLLKS